MELLTRKTRRLREYDYASNGAYFITICVQNRHELLGKIAVGDAHLDVPMIRLNETGDMEICLNMAHG